ncbi:MAG: hypothetical protein R2702_17955 [Acidimicrobiales bacterium]
MCTGRSSTSSPLQASSCPEAPHPTPAALDGQEPLLQLRERADLLLGSRAPSSCRRRTSPSTRAWAASTASGYPTAAVRTSGDKRSRYQNYAGGRIYARGHGHRDPRRRVHQARADPGRLRPSATPPTTSSPPATAAGKIQWFEKGLVFYTPTTGAFGLWGDILSRYADNGGVTGYLRYPTSEPTPVGDGRGTYATFERGRIYDPSTTSAFEVHGAVLTTYLDEGGPTGALGYPTSELDPRGTPGGRFQRFENGTIQYVSDSDVQVTLNP